MKGVIRVLDKIQEYIIIFLLTLCTVAGTLQVICRFVLHAPLPWSEEFIRYSFVWIIFLGASLGVKNNAHAGITLFVNILPKALRSILSVISKILCIAFSVIVFKEGINIMAVQFQTKQLTAAMEIPIYYVFLAIPVSAVTMIIYYIISIFKSNRQETNGKEAV